MTVARSNIETPINRSINLQTASVKVKAYVALTKPRIMLLLLFTAYCAMIVANERIPSLGVTIATLAGLALSTGGAATINMWYDRDIDAIMQRTSWRPIPSGIVSANGALIFGIALQVFSIFVLGLFVNWLTSALTFVGFIYYAVIYTMWLKRRTPQNVVIGGGAGAFPPLIGWAAITGHLSSAAWIMFLIVFLWTPPHFWALALFKNEDYVRANIPMMPVVKGAQSTKRQTLVYTVLLVFASLALLFTGNVKPLYVIIAVVSGILFCAHAIMLSLESNSKMIWAKRTFFYSLVYLPTIFIFMVLGTNHLWM